MEEESQEQREARVRSLWAQLDTRNEDSLDLPGLKRGLTKLDHPLKNAHGLLEDVLEAADINNDGRIQYHEFRRFVYETEQELWSLFKSIDRDHSGNLDKSELRTAFVKAGLAVPNSRLDKFFDDVDTNNDGVISFDEWRNFLLFMPANAPGLKAVFSYYQSTVKLTSEGEVNLSDETVQGLGTTASFLSTRLFGAILQIASPASLAGEDQAYVTPAAPAASIRNRGTSEAAANKQRPSEVADVPETLQHRIRSVLTVCVPDPGYFLAGGLAGVASRTTTAPLDRLKVYLISQTGVAEEALHAAKKGAAVQATKAGATTFINACKDLWAAGGIRSLFAGNGINVIKVMPESAVKFGSYEASKRAIAELEGHSDTSRISPVSQFCAGGIAGMVSQAVVYPLDTLKFRMQCETVGGGLRGNALIIDTARKMWARNGIVSFYRGLPMGLAGMFPYAAIDLGTFEYLKRKIIVRYTSQHGGHEEDALPGSVVTAFIGGFSGAFGASAVYPMNLLRTRLQAQGTASHPRTYTGIVDVTRQTIKGEGVRGLFKGLTPNLLKVVPAVSITYVVYEQTKKALHLR